MVSEGSQLSTTILNVEVLILVVVEDGLGVNLKATLLEYGISLNPCCSGRWSRSFP